MAVMRSLNKVLLIGNLTRSPEIKELENGTKLCTFGVATNSGFKKKDGTEDDVAEFHNVVAWNKLGEICVEILDKGMLVYIEGEIRTRVWEDESGEKKYRTEIRADEMKLLDDKKDGKESEN